MLELFFSVSITQNDMMNDLERFPEMFFRCKLEVRWLKKVRLRARRKTRRNRVNRLGKGHPRDRDSHWQKGRIRRRDRLIDCLYKYGETIEIQEDSKIPATSFWHSAATIWAAQYRWFCRFVFDNHQQRVFHIINRFCDKTTIVENSLCQASAWRNR